MEVGVLLRRHGVLRVDPRLVDPWFGVAYEWMRGAMERMIPEYHGGYPWWAFVDYPMDYRVGIPILPAEERLYFELGIDRSRLLISDYGRWHSVLGGNFVAESAEAEELWDAELMGKGLSGWPIPEPWRSKVSESWQEIFNVCADPHGEGREDVHPQAVFEELRWSDVLSVRTLAVRD